MKFNAKNTENVYSYLEPVLVLDVHVELAIGGLLLITPPLTLSCCKKYSKNLQIYSYSCVISDLSMMNDFLKKNCGEA